MCWAPLAFHTPYMHGQLTSTYTWGGRDGVAWADRSGQTQILAPPPQQGGLFECTHIPLGRLSAKLAIHNPMLSARTRTMHVPRHTMVRMLISVGLSLIDFI